MAHRNYKYDCALHFFHYYLYDNTLKFFSISHNQISLGNIFDIINKIVLHITVAMENTTSGEISGSFNEATHEEIIQNVYTRTPYSESHPNDLAGSIHPMFARGNWYIHPTIYSHNSDHHQFFKVMDPVFRLASNLLQSPNSRLFLAAFFFAARHPLVELSNRLGREARQFNRIEGKDYSKVVSRTTTLLNRLAGQIGFEWYDPVDEIAIVPRNAYGYCTRKLRTHAYMSKSGRPTGYVSRISLSLELFVKLRDLRLSLQESSSANVEGILVSNDSFYPPIDVIKLIIWFALVSDSSPPICDGIGIVP